MLRKSSAYNNSTRADHDKLIGVRLPFARVMVDQGRMLTLRPYLLAFLILLILPWGAYFAGPVAAAPINITVDASEAHEIIASPHKTCRIAVLPGSPCGPDLALPTLHQAPAVTKAAPDTSIPPAVLGQGRSPAPSRDPPRAA